MSRTRAELRVGFEYLSVGCASNHDRVIGMHFVNQVDIGRPIATVFAYVADFENVPAWNYAIDQTHKMSEGPVGVGTTYRQLRTLPAPSEEEFEVTAFAPPGHVAINGVIGPFDAEMKYDLEPHENGTRLINHVTLGGRGLAGAVGQLGGSRVKSAVATNLKELKRILEAT